MDGFCSNQVRDYCKSCNSSNYKRHGCSKAQACLNKILHIISSIEPPPVKNPSLKSQAGDELIESNSGDEYFGGKRKGFDIDLNLVCPPWKSGESTESLVENGVLSACSFVYKEQEEEQEEEKTTDGSSDITNSQVDSIQGEGEGEEEEDELKRAARGNGGGGGGGGNNDYLGLLIAAAELISSGEDDKKKKKKQVMMSHDDDDEDDEKNNKKWRVDEGDTSAVVGSKRGRRSQVLPHRYRDSVVLLEPRKRLKTTTNTRSRYN